MTWLFPLAATIIVWILFAYQLKRKQTDDVYKQTGREESIIFGFLFAVVTTAVSWVFYAWL